MRKLVHVLPIIFFASITLAFAQENTPTPKEIPIGMEEVRLGSGATLIVPKGAKTREIGSQVIVEGTKEYMSRRFYELDIEKEKSEKVQGGFQTQLDELAARVKTLENRAAYSEEIQKKFQAQLKSLEGQTKELQETLEKLSKDSKAQPPKEEKKQK